MTITVGIYLFPGVEVLDFAGPFEVFTTASRVSRRTRPDQTEPFRALTVARCEDAVLARAGLRVLPDCAFATCPPLDVLIVPGGVVDREMRDPRVIDWIQTQAQHASICASVCTGAFLLAQAGLLGGKTATTHWEDISDLQAQFGDIQVVANTRWVDQGSILTSAGIAAGIDMSLHLVSRLAGHGVAVATARQLEVAYDP